MNLKIAAAIALFLAPLPCRAGDLPDHKLTPGVTRDLSLKEVCETKWGKDHRAVTAAMKRQVFEEYGLTGNTDPSCRPDAHGRHFEVDHLISRELAGADAVKNLWPQCYSGKWNAVMKDRLENRLHKLVCDKTLTLEQAQDAISSDWIKAYEKFVK